MNLVGYQFRFSLLGTLLAIVGISIFFSLGTWQVNRAGVKQALQDKIDSRQNTREFLLQSFIKDIEKKTYMPVKALGEYDQKNEILIDNEIHNGQAGYHVLTPLILKNDQSVIMVNRGWVPVGRNRQILPEIDSPLGDQVVTGMIYPHKSKPALVLDQANLSSSKVWAYFDSGIYAEYTGYKLLPVVLLMNADETNGYIRNWPAYDARVAMHIGYAIQWYVFAVIVLITYIAVNLKKKQVSE